MYTESWFNVRRGSSHTEPASSPRAEAWEVSVTFPPLSSLPPLYTPPLFFPSRPPFYPLPSPLPSFPFPFPTPSPNLARGSGAVSAPPAGSGAEPRPETNLVHFKAVQKRLVAIILSIVKCIFYSKMIKIQQDEDQRQVLLVRE